MIYAADFLSEKQRKIIIKLFSTLYGPIRTESSVMDEINLEINFLSSNEAISNYIDRYHTTGFLRFKTLEENAIADLDCETKKLIETTRKINNLQSTLKLLEELKRTDLDSVIQKMTGLKRLELFGVEYRRTLLVLKDIQLSCKGNDINAPLTETKVIKVYVEHRNPKNKDDHFINKLFQLNWNEKGKLHDKLLKYRCLDIKIDEEIITRRIRNKFNIVEVFPSLPDIQELEKLYEADQCNK